MGYVSGYVAGATIANELSENATGSFPSAKEGFASGLWAWIKDSLKRMGATLESV